MKYKANPNTRVLIIWLILICMVTSLVYYSKQSDDWWWFLSLGGFLFPILLQLWMHFVSYEIEDHELKVTPYTYWNSSIDLNKLIQVRKRKSSWMQRILGMPPFTIELFIEREGHMELWADDDRLLNELEAYARSGNPSHSTA